MHDWIENIELSKIRIGIVGLGYVGLPLSITFGKYYDTVGFDTSAERIKEINDGIDRNNELTRKEVELATSLLFTDEEKKLSDRDVIIITVPTPINRDNKPDLGPLIKASEMVGTVMKREVIIIYESTVYPGVTEGVCVPI